MRIKALSGIVGMMALVRAFYDAGRAFEMETMYAVPVEAKLGPHFLFTIGDTTAALSLRETQWFADQLIELAAPGPVTADLQRFGRMMLAILAEAPGPHGVN